MSATSTARRPGRARRAGSAPTRPLLVGLGLAVVCLLAVVVTLGTGPLRVAVVDLVPTLLGERPRYEYAVLDTGLPRALLAVVVGVALGAAGALTQSLTRNPLGSPDLIGLDAGAATGALVALLVLGWAGPAVPALALLGGLATAGLVFTIARGASGAGYRLVLVGIAAAALLQGLNSFLLTRSDPRTAIEGSRWLVGSLNLAGEVDSLWTPLVAVSAAVAVLLPAAVLLVRPLRVLATGEDVGTAVGVPVGGVQTATVVVAVLLAASAVAVAGPITFVALVAPQLVAGLVRRPGPTVVTAGLMGGALLVTADLLAQRVLPGFTPPVGVVTGVLGGGYLAWLLARGRRTV